VRQWNERRAEKGLVCCGTIPLARSGVNLSPPLCRADGTFEWHIDNREISSTWAKDVTLTSAVGTNDRCMVVANGVDNRTGNQATFVLSLADQSLCNNP
jgi:hypothetical protein